MGWHSCCCSWQGARCRHCSAAAGGTATTHPAGRRCSSCRPLVACLGELLLLSCVQAVVRCGGARGSAARPSLVQQHSWQGCWCRAVAAMQVTCTVSDALVRCSSLPWAELGKHQVFHAASNSKLHQSMPSVKPTNCAGPSLQSVQAAGMEESLGCACAYQRRAGRLCMKRNAKGCATCSVVMHA
jgi:hypothetical protein